MRGRVGEVWRGDALESPDGKQTLDLVVVNARRLRTPTSNLFASFPFVNDYM